MLKFVIIGAGSGFGAKTVIDILSYEELRECEIVLVDINPSNLEPVVRYARRIAEHHAGPTVITSVDGWRDGVLDGADYVLTAFAQGGPAYRGVPFRYEIEIPLEYGIAQYIADTAGIGGVLRTMRCAPELLAIGHDMEKRCPDAWLLNHVNPMAMLTRTMLIACPEITTVGLCHNVQGAARRIARQLGLESHHELRYLAAGVNHMDWFLRVEYLDGRDAYPDLIQAYEDSDEKESWPGVQVQLLKHLGHWTTESNRHCSEYVPWFAHDPEARASVGLEPRQPVAEDTGTAPRWEEDSSLMKQLAGTEDLNLVRSAEYGPPIIHARETDAYYRVNVNVLNRGMIENLPDGYCVEVPCTVDRTGLHPHHVGALPIQLAAPTRGLADMQTLASDAVLEKDLRKACQACIIDPATAACATPAQITECFNRLIEIERKWLEPYWGADLKV
jgi:alpha-galactosidase